MIKREHVDSSLGDTIKPVIYGSVAAKLAGVKSRISMIIGTGYLFTTTTVKAKFLKFIAVFLDKIGLRCSSTVIFQNNDDCNEFINNGIIQQYKTRVVNGSGVNMELFITTTLPSMPVFLINCS